MVADMLINKDKLHSETVMIWSKFIAKYPVKVSEDRKLYDAETGLQFSDGLFKCQLRREWLNNAGNPNSLTASELNKRMESFISVLKNSYYNAMKKHLIESDTPISEEKLS